MDTPHILYTLALQADERFTAMVAARTDGRRDRWTMTAQDMLIPEIKDAYHAKLVADEAWLTFLRADSEARTKAARSMKTTVVALAAALLTLAAPVAAQARLDTLRATLDADQLRLMRLAPSTERSQLTEKIHAESDLIMALTAPRFATREPLRLDAGLAWAPYVAMVAGQYSDAVTTLHQLNNPRRPCVESNALLGPRPTVLGVIAPKLALVAGGGLLLKLEQHAASRGGRWVAKGTAYFIGALGAGLAAHNLQTCGW